MSNHIKLAKLVSKEITTPSTGRQNIKYILDQYYNNCSIIHFVVNIFTTGGSLLGIVGALIIKNGYYSATVGLTATGSTDSKIQAIAPDSAYSGNGINLVANLTNITDSTLIQCSIYD